MWDDIAVGIKEIGLNKSFTLNQNYPNPYDVETMISYSLTNSGQVNLSVYSTTGKLIEQLVNMRQTQGEYRVNYNAENLTEGIYYYKLETEGQTEVRKMVVMKQ